MIKKANTQIKIYLLLQILMLASLFSECPHLVCQKQAPSIILHYNLEDLGEIDLDAKAMTRQNHSASLGPAINNKGDIIANSSKGGFIRKHEAGDYAPQINDAKLNFYAINSIGDILVSIERPSDDVEWLLWPSCQGWDNPRRPVDTVELEGNKVKMLKVNDHRMIMGEAHPDDRSMPLSWQPECGLYRIGYSQGLYFLGTVIDLNNNGSITGKSHHCLEQFPYVWNEGQMHHLFQLRKAFKIPSDSKIVFEDLSINDHDVLYGTYWINKEFFENNPQPKKTFQAFKWDIVNNKLTLLDIDGMRISAVNNSGRMVGSVNGRATFVDENYKPLEILKAVPENQKIGWELIEATDINESGQIVGFGNKNGKMHLFLASPLVDKNHE